MWPSRSKKIQASTMPAQLQLSAPGAAVRSRGGAKETGPPGGRPRGGRNTRRKPEGHNRILAFVEERRASARRLHRAVFAGARYEPPAEQSKPSRKTCR